MTGSASIAALYRAIRDLHGCESEWIESVAVHETFEDETVWEGEVQVFHLLNHPEATRCYAWSYSVEGSERRRYFAVLHAGPVDSPQTAVQAAVVKSFRDERAK